MDDENLDDAAREAWNAIDEDLRQKLRAMGVRPSHEAVLSAEAQEAISKWRSLTDAERGLVMYWLHRGSENSTAEIGVAVLRALAR